MGRRRDDVGIRRPQVSDSRVRARPHVCGLRPPVHRPARRTAPPRSDLSAPRRVVARRHSVDPTRIRHDEGRLRPRHRPWRGNHWAMGERSRHPESRQRPLPEASRDASCDTGTPAPGDDCLATRLTRCCNLCLSRLRPTANGNRTSVAPGGGWWRGDLSGHRGTISSNTPTTDGRTADLVAANARGTRHTARLAGQSSLRSGGSGAGATVERHRKRRAGRCGAPTWPWPARPPHGICLRHGWSRRGSCGFGQGAVTWDSRAPQRLDGCPVALIPEPPRQTLMCRRVSPSRAAPAVGVSAPSLNLPRHRHAVPLPRARLHSLLAWIASAPPTTMEPFREPGVSRGTSDPRRRASGLFWTAHHPGVVP